VINNFRYERFILFLGILFIEDAVRCTLHVATAETVLAAVGEEATVGEIGIIDEDLTAEEDVVTVVADNSAFVTLVDFRSILVDVPAALGAEHELITVCEILAILHIEAGAAILAVLEVVSAAMLEIVSARGLHDHPFFHFPYFFSEGLVLLMGSEINVLHLLFVLCARELDIFKAVLAFPQTCAEETILATDAILEKRARVAVHAVLAPDEAVRFVYVHVVVAELAMEVIEAVHA